MESSLSQLDIHALLRLRGQVFVAQQSPESRRHRHGCESTLLDTPQTTNVLILMYFVVAAGVHCAKAVRLFDQKICLMCVAVKGLI